MTDIWIDPTELKATAGLLGQQAQRINEAIAAVNAGKALRNVIVF